MMRGGVPSSPRGGSCLLNGTVVLFRPPWATPGHPRPPWANQQGYSTNHMANSIEKFGKNKILPTGFDCQPGWPIRQIWKKLIPITKHRTNKSSPSTPKYQISVPKSNRSLIVSKAGQYARFEKNKSPSQNTGQTNQIGAPHKISNPCSENADDLGRRI